MARMWAAQRRCKDSSDDLRNAETPFPANSTAGFWRNLDDTRGRRLRHLGLFMTDPRPRKWHRCGSPASTFTIHFQVTYSGYMRRSRNRSSRAWLTDRCEMPTLDGEDLRTEVSACAAGCRAIPALPVLGPLVHSAIAVTIGSNSRAGWQGFRPPHRRFAHSTPEMINADEKQPQACQSPLRVRMTIIRLQELVPVAAGSNMRFMEIGITRQTEWYQPQKGVPWHLACRRRRKPPNPSYAP